MKGKPNLSSPATFYLSDKFRYHQLVIFHEQALNWRPCFQNSSALSTRLQCLLSCSYLSSSSPLGSPLHTKKSVGSLLPRMFLFSDIVPEVSLCLFFSGLELSSRHPSAVSDGRRGLQCYLPTGGAGGRRPTRS